MPVYCLIAKSVQYDPKWLARQQAINATLTQMFNQKLKVGWDQIRAADAAHGRDDEAAEAIPRQRWSSGNCHALQRRWRLREFGGRFSADG